ncbi:MAG: hypothetical protein ACOVP4_01115 [Bacteriovoracaceae bacterium]
MMKKTTPLLLATLALFAIGCNQKSSKNTSTSTADQYNYLTGGAQSGTTTSGTTTSGSTTGNPQTGGTGYWPWTYTPETKPFPQIVCSNLSVTGETCSDFDTVYSTIPTYPIIIAGGQIWGPGLSPTGNVSVGVFPTVNEMVAVTQTDTKLRVRFRMLAQPKPVAGKEYCHGRATGQSADYCPYSKLKLQVGAVPKAVWQQYLSGQNPYLGNYMRTVTHDGSNGISSGRCSVWYDLPHVAGQDYVIVVKDISSDNECRYRTGLGTPSYNGVCPNNTALRTASCASLEMQIQTDYTSY